MSLKVGALLRYCITPVGTLPSPLPSIQISVFSGVLGEACSLHLCNLLCYVEYIERMLGFAVGNLMKRPRSCKKIL